MDKYILFAVKRGCLSLDYKPWTIHPSLKSAMALVEKWHPDKEWEITDGSLYMETEPYPRDINGTIGYKIEKCMELKDKNDLP
jgi:hypothetical protein